MTAAVAAVGGTEHSSGTDGSAAIDSAEHQHHWQQLMAQLEGFLLLLPFPQR